MSIHFTVLSRFIPRPIIQTIYDIIQPIEINESESIILCSKVILRNKEKTTIKVPNKGEKVTQKKFDEIEKKKTASMKNDEGVIIFEH